MSISVGTSGWHYPGGRGTWNGIFYPARRPTGFDELRYYAEHFDTVEVNATFYRMPDAPMTERWLERTPNDFQFSVKLFQKFTHPDLYLARNGVRDWDLSRADVDQFRAGVDPLLAANRLAAVLMQFPPSVHRTPETRAYLDWLLGAFYDLPAAVELRHRSWSDETADTAACLAEHRAAWVFIDEPKFASSIRQDASLSTPVELIEPVATGSSLSYLRLHGRNAAQWWDHAEAEDRYDYLYSADELRPIASRVRADEKSGRRVVAYFNNHFSAKAVANAAILKDALGLPVPGDYPREMINRYPELSGVVRTDGLPM